ncbi:hypothetical protein [uncultured Alsobacter sp.]|uniref:hypothetical protein n=1 Tax=uncultured Alsobacter sp. TaxID=1748258 RepID=UPI0025FE9CF2|nr:hypothetical protein [uncultured Alsobacter sp.]
MTIEITVIKTKNPTRFTAINAATGERLVTTATPFFDAARYFLRRGARPSTPIVMRHQGSDEIAMRSTVGAAARLTVKDSPHGPVFVKWKPFNPKLGASR